MLWKDKHDANYLNIIDEHYCHLLRTTKINCSSRLTNELRPQAPLIPYCRGKHRRLYRSEDTLTSSWADVTCQITIKNTGVRWPSKWTWMVLCLFMDIIHYIRRKFSFYADRRTRGVNDIKECVEWLNHPQHDSWTLHQRHTSRWERSARGNRTERAVNWTQTVSQHGHNEP